MRHEDHHQPWVRPGALPRSGFVSGGMISQVEFLREILSACGLDPDGPYAGIDIRVRIDEAVSVAVHSLYDAKHDPALADAVRRFHLTPIERVDP